MKRQDQCSNEYSIGNHPRKKRHESDSYSSLDEEQYYQQQNYHQESYHNYDEDCRFQDQNKKTQFILQQSLAKRMVMQGDAFLCSIDGKQFYFPYKKMNEPQQDYIKAIFDCLDKKQNLLIESPTGTGKTLSLLVGALSWAERHYMKSFGGMFQNRLKIIYTSRAHSQLSQISKQLKKTPYRPKMLLFGSRQKMCINEQLKSQIQGQGDKSYNDWNHRCNIAVEMRKKQLSNQDGIKKEIYQILQTIQEFKSKSYLSTDQRNQLKRTEDQLKFINSRCKHFHEYTDNQDKKFNREVGRKVLNSQTLKNLAKERQPNSICPYFYPKRVKMMGTLYLMPYNYLLDSVILEYSTNFLKDAIIIFDEGHNVPATACNGYSIKFNTSILDAAKRNALDRLNENDFDADEIELQNLMKESEQYQRRNKQKAQKGQNMSGQKRKAESLMKEEKEQVQCQKSGKQPFREDVQQKKQKFSQKSMVDFQQKEKLMSKPGKQMTILDKWMLKIPNKPKRQETEWEDANDEIQKTNPQSHSRKKPKDSSLSNDKENLKDQTQFLANTITNTTKNFDQFFKHEREDFEKPSNNFHSQGVDTSNTKNTYWSVVRQHCAYKKDEIQSIVSRIFFLSVMDRMKALTLKQRLDTIIASIKYVYDFFIKTGKYAFKLFNLSRFYERLHRVLYDKNYEHKFFIHVSQFKKYVQKKDLYQFKGEIQIKCLSPEFSFNQLQNINPYNIIITSGTLSPLKAFEDDIGLKFVKTQVGHVIGQDNILVRKIAKNLKGEPLKIDSGFFYEKNSIFNTQNLIALFNLLIKTIDCIPHGVLIIVSSFPCLKVIEKFYNHQLGRDVRKRLEAIKPHVYFEPKNNLEVTMDRYIANSQNGKGAVMFCVCRAKLSEGIDFKDRLCRSVIFLGIPYVSKGDQFIVHKSAYLKKIKSPHSSVWKFIEASKAINQGLGRTVRHAKDFGSILLIDDRYENVNRDSSPVVDNISGWIRKDWKVNNDIGSLQNQLRKFYARCDQKFPSQNSNIDEGQSSLRDYFQNKF